MSSTCKYRRAQRLLVFSLLFMAVVQGAICQDSPQTPSPSGPELTLFSRSELVLVPVVVSNHAGQHMSGLRVSDFRLRENGQPQKISIFEEINALAEPLRRQNSPGTYTNSFDRPAARRLVVIAVDTVNTQFLDQSWGRRQLMSFLTEHVNTGALFVLLTMNSTGVRVIHDATSDPSVLIAALQKVKGLPLEMEPGKAPNNGPLPGQLNVKEPDSKTDTEVPQIKQLANQAAEKLSDQIRVNTLKVTLESLETIARIYAGVPGRKTLVWVTGSFPYNPLDEPEYEHTWRVLNDANFAIYGVDLRGLVNPGAFSAEIARFSDNWVPKQSNLNTDTVTTLQLFAAATGGKAFYNSNDIGLSLDRATRDSGSYYLLGYYRSPRDTTPGWRTLKVSVFQKKAQVRTRNGFFVFQRPRQTSVLDDIQLALLAPLEFTGLPLAFQWTRPSSTVEAASGEESSTGFELAILPSSGLVTGGNGSQVDLQFSGIATDADGKLRGQFSKTIATALSPSDLKIAQERGFIYKGQFQLRPGEYTVRIAVRDNISGRMGSLIVPLQVH